MDKFWEFAKIVAIVGGTLFALILILLSLPRSPLRQMLLKGLSAVFYLLAGLGVLYIISPADLLPDIIPLLGQVDDLGALVTALISAVGATVMFLQGRQPVDKEELPDKTIDSSE
jgi:uncharacterized membrane protein YkvA (DUF1232 family)